jgi:ubiquinol-cytochrome c reductase iron-sulfur subunit
MLRLCPRRQLLAVPAKSVVAQRRGITDTVKNAGGEYERTSAVNNPFKSDSNPTTKIPSFAKYMSKRGEMSNKTFQYFMVGSMGLLTAAGAKATVEGR